MHGMETATDDITRALAIEARVICTKATDFLDEKPEEVLDDSEEEREMNTSITPFDIEGSMERTHLMLADLEWQYEFQQQKFKEQSLLMQACQYSLSIIKNDLRDFEVMLDEFLGADWQQQEEAFQVQNYVAAKSRC
ncbi:hypothetical protein MRB53_026835 [Persea americana]|uniref:Uncharacterized protein n=1 Tax=Persea americana TaxID=3435 RepID=A0ACC2LJE7_PERAE|nr:hypothetical protein MRB53_026835 [Persea americana]